MNDFVIPSNPVDQKKIRDAVDELSNSMLRVSSEKALQKDIKDGIKESLEVPPAVLNWMAKQSMEDTFEETVSKEEAKQTLYETIMLANSNQSDDEEDES